MIEEKQRESDTDIGMPELIRYTSEHNIQVELNLTQEIEELIESTLHYMTSIA